MTDRRIRSIMKEIIVTLVKTLVSSITMGPLFTGENISGINFNGLNLLVEHLSSIVVALV